MKIAWLGLLDSDDMTGLPRAQEHLMRLAQQVVAASGYGWEIELISCGSQPGTHAVSAGIDRVVLPTAGRAQTVWDRVSWDLPDAIDRADLVHLHDGFSRSCELALLIAKQLHKPLCVTQWGIEGHWLSTELQLRDLADVIVCHDSTVARTVAGRKPVELIACDIDVRRLGVPAPWPANACLDMASREVTSPAHEQYAAAGATLYRVYHRLIASTRRAAA